MIFKKIENIEKLHIHNRESSINLLLIVTAIKYIFYVFFCLFEKFMS